MSKRNTELSFGANSATIEPDENGALPSYNELRSLLGDDEFDDTFISGHALEEMRQTAIKAGTRKRAKRTINNRIAQERKRLDAQVAHLAATDPRDRDSNPFLTEKQNQALQRQKAETEANLQALELAREQLNLSTSQLIRDEMDGQSLAPRAATLAQENLKPEVARLLASLNMNLDLSLNGRQTELLMSSLLACNEHQIAAILDNDKTPIAVKLMAKRLKDDLKAGSTTALTDLWDRLFGKGILDINGQAAEYKRSLSAKQQTSQTVVNLGGNTQVVNGRVLNGQDTNRLLHDAALPDQPLSREAYQMIRDRFATEADEATYEEVPDDQIDDRPRQAPPANCREYEDLIDDLAEQAANEEEIRVEDLL